MTKEPKSDCCKDECITHCADEGTCYTSCLSCGKPCNPVYEEEAEEKPRKIIMWVTADKGEGKVMNGGEFESIEDIEIDLAFWDKNCVISFEYSN